MVESEQTDVAVAALQVLLEATAVGDEEACEDGRSGCMACTQ